MSSIYLAASYARREELLQYRKDLLRLGHVITSRWLDGKHEMDKPGEPPREPDKEVARFAKEDFYDIEDATHFVTFTEPSGSVNVRGGRHVELGIALGLEKLIVAIGPKEHAFHYLPSIWFFSTWSEALEFLGRKLKRGINA